MNKIKEKNEAYKKKIIIRNLSILLVSLATLSVAFIISTNIGYTKLSPMDVLRIILGGGSSEESLIIFSFRLPRIVMSIMVGLGLALSGCIIQGLSKNDLADPGLLGITSGAGLMVVLYTLFFSMKSFLAMFTIPFLALAGGGITAIFIYLLSYKRDEGSNPMRLILTGVAVQAGISAIMIILTVKLNDQQLQYVSRWMAGSLHGSNWKLILALLPWILILVPLAFYKARFLDVLNLGEDVAKNLGTSVERERRILLAISVALASSCVSVSGGIGFVGLISPHLARKLVGPKHKILLPVCGLVGAVLVTAGDTIGRWIVQPNEIPTGIVVAIIGAPYFLYLLTKSK